LLKVGGKKKTGKNMDECKSQRSAESLLHIKSWGRKNRQKRGKKKGGGK